MDIDFSAIVPAATGKHAAFEELCCQLARRTDQSRTFVRLRGDGGDGGVECYIETPTGKRGWQVKYVFDPTRLIMQASKSFRTALRNYPDLESFVLCFPFDPTGKTTRGQAGVQKLEEWKRSELSYAKEKGRAMEIELWSAGQLRDRIVEYDCSGGMNRFFFGDKVLTDQWFKAHLDNATAAPGPRYTPELNVPTDITKWFAAFGRTDAWSNALADRLRSLQKELRHLRVGAIETRGSADSAAADFGTWPGDSGPTVSALATGIKKVIEAFQHPQYLNYPEYLEMKVALQSSMDRMRSVERALALDIDHKYGEGASDSPGWRQLASEWDGALPAANLDSTRDVLRALKDLLNWLDSPAFALAFDTSFVLTGEAGSGKTHGICDISRQRHEEGRRTCLLFGHQFMGEPDPWTKIAETLSLIGLGREELLDTMDAAGEASGAPLLICIDAINETKPLYYWKNHLRSMFQAVSSRQFVRLCIVCRTPYVPTCLPEQSRLRQVEHQGFSGNQREACRAYCEHYDLQPPTLPILVPELRNPLYLRLVCETARSLGLQRLPADWSGSVKTMDTFLDQKEELFAQLNEIPAHANMVRKALTALADHLVDQATTAIPWSTAMDVLEQMARIGSERSARYLQWLVGEGLLIDDAPRGTEGTLRLAFERLGDFLLADAFLRKNTDVPSKLTSWINTVENIKPHSGMLGVLSVLLPERHDIELPDVADDTATADALLELTVSALPSRSQFAFADRSEALIDRALGMPHLSFRAMEALVSIGWRPSTLDAHWFDRRLRSMSLAERDADWCSFLHGSFSAERAVAELIEAAGSTSLENLDAPIAERWTILLLWFTAAADRRVKDGATRAAVAVVAAQPSVLPTLIASMRSIDDDAVRERILLVAYGVLLKTRHLDTVKGVATILHRDYTNDPSAFSNALLRDHIRSICEFAAHLGVLPKGIDPQFASEVGEGSEWPLALPSTEETKAWSKPIRLWPDNFLSDFFKYSMTRMEQWEGGMSRENMTKWILKTIAQDFRFVGSNCERYDRQMLRDYGGGRGKPMWAERIGKKYMWVAMYQLASRLHDNVAPKRRAWEPKPLRRPYVLAEGRQLDPTLPRSNDSNDGRRFFVTPRLDTVGTSDDRVWIALEKDVPNISELIQVQVVSNQEWRPLMAYLSSGDRQDGAPYRQTWMHLFGYLVSAGDAALLLEKLDGRNLLGGWMPNGSRFGGGGFVAEYPWATSFNVMPDEWYETGGDEGLLKGLVPAWNDLCCEWEYDASLEDGAITVMVPARRLFEGEGLWWDGEGGFRRSDGRTVFLDPSVAAGGPHALMADVEHLEVGLRKNGQCMFWALLGGKLMMGGSMTEVERTPMRTFSQSAWMGPDGTLHQNELVFFDNPNEGRGLADAPDESRAERDDQENLDVKARIRYV